MWQTMIENPIFIGVVIFLALGIMMNKKGGGNGKNRNSGGGSNNTPPPSQPSNPK